jgi:beta-glucanase (GH16 family)
VTKATAKRTALVALALLMGASGWAVPTTAEAASPVGSGRGIVNAPPVTEVLSPTGPTRGPVVVRGRAVDDRGVTTVKLTVKDRTTGRYWNPARGRWQRQWLWYDTTLASPRSAATEWSFAFEPGTSGSGRYQATAVAWDVAGTRDPGVSRRRFRIESGAVAVVPPETAITTPTEGALLDEGPLTVTGTTTDDTAVGVVRVVIRDLEAGRHWNPDLGTWQADWAWFPASVATPGAPTSTWTYPFDPTGSGGSGRYRISATAWDHDGNQDASAAAVDVTMTMAEPPAEGRTLVWNDEFDGTTLDPTRWKTFSGLYNTPYCFQNYTARPENVRVEDGRLILQAHAEESNGQPYSSGMVVSNDFRQPAVSSHRGNTAWRYGRFEMRARVPDVSGMWPAFWMRPRDTVYGSWPRSGEIDILEYAGPTPTSWNDRRIVHDLHYWSGTSPTGKGSANGQMRVSEAWLDEFHTFAVEWDEDGFRWFVDGRLTHEARRGSTPWAAPDAPSPAPFDQAFFITLNLQVGGWAGAVDDAAMPAAFEVDWVRVYQ